MELASILLFNLGSALYVVCAVDDYQWSQTLLQLPEWLRGLDDDVQWTRYRLEEMYGDVSSMTGPTGRRLGGVRRRLMREHYKKHLYEHYDELDESNGVRGAQKQPNRKLQQTPEELYYDLDWECLPAEIQAAYMVLGYNQNEWDNSIEVATDSMEWDMLSPVEQEAALFIGYTEMVWCEWDDAFVPEADSPTPTSLPSVATSEVIAISESPSLVPSVAKSEAPSLSPTNVPSVAISEIPSLEPSASARPSLANFIMAPDGSFYPRPTMKPTNQPTLYPTTTVTEFPSSDPSVVSLCKYEYLTRASSL
jgi:hypothetical protein